MLSFTRLKTELFRGYIDIGDIVLLNTGPPAHPGCDKES